MKGQSNIISIFLITSIVIALVGIAYTWGMPLIEKRTTSTDFEIAKSFALKINQEVISIANGDSNQKSLTLPLGSAMAFAYDDISGDNNSIVYEFLTNQPLVFPGNVFYIGDTSFEDTSKEVGTYGEASPSVITLTSRKVGTGYVMKIRIRFRELDTTSSPKRGYVIAINSLPNIGKSFITISFDGAETVKDAAFNGGDLVKTKVKVTVS